MRCRDKKEIALRAVERGNVSELGAQGRSHPLEDFFVDGVTFKPLHENAALRQPCLGESVKLSRE
jgi:hypothetical protein